VPFVREMYGSSDGASSKDTFSLKVMVKAVSLVAAEYNWYAPADNVPATFVTLTTCGGVSSSDKVEKVLHKEELAGKFVIDPASIVTD